MGNKTQDIYVVIEGYDKPTQQGAESTQYFQGQVNQRFNSAKYLETHLPLMYMRFCGGITPNPTGEIIARISRVQDAKTPIGDVVLSGGSAGGRNILAVGQALTQKQIPISFIGVWDGAFDRPDRQGLLKNPGVTAKTKTNWYQKWGESLDEEGVQEIHDEIAGFDNINCDTQPEMLALRAAYFGASAAPGIFGSLVTKTGAVRQKFWESAHTITYKIGREASEWTAWKTLRDNGATVGLRSS